MARINDDEDCQYRCILTEKNNSLLFQPWISFNASTVRPECDTIEVKCTENDKTTYEFLHQQIFRRQPYNPPPQQTPGKPNVHVILLDAVSMPHFLRAMPNTAHFLKNDLGAHFFKYHNKAAYNSEPNAFILYMNKLTQKLFTDPTEANIPYENVEYLDACADNSTYIGKLYKDQGYRVMINEDWSVQINRNCISTDGDVFDHSSFPYWTYKNEKFPSSFIVKSTNLTGRDFYHSNRWRKYCHDRHLIMFDYIKEFVKSYNNEPKLSMTWMRVLAHDNRRDIFQYDDDFLRFFQEFKNEVRLIQWGT
ncbi:unnamed protein product [Bursaphelenchus xylophilus]|uniref:(pine wood nematode) hypothetical protein n=1 Tax=Bursaphelenchus xylophilus TaxID=6326 RepID=A0A7I8WVJ5_BURXY|nr:unnamed protein product [Bursaphelenchus xylophilus]CAG9117757.1 unnamed protein product [Bursaphelenchus xylophilus]